MSVCFCINPTREFKTHYKEYGPDLPLISISSKEKIVDLISGNKTAYVVFKDTVRFKSKEFKDMVTQKFLEELDLSDKIIYLCHQSNETFLCANWSQKHELVDVDAFCVNNGVFIVRGDNYQKMLEGKQLKRCLYNYSMLYETANLPMKNLKMCHVNADYSFTENYEKYGPELRF